jgi:hypothetical protein
VYLIVNIIFSVVVNAFAWGATSWRIGS